MNELAADDDPTSELEIPKFRRDRPGADNSLRESDARTFDLEDAARNGNSASMSQLRSDLRSRGHTIDKLQYDIEQLRAKWLGLDAEIHARKELTENLRQEVGELRRVVGRKDKLLRTRAASIKALKAEIRDRDLQFRELRAGYENLQRTTAELETSVAEAESALLSARDELAAVHVRPDDDSLRPQADLYTDSLRRKLQDLMQQNEAMANERRRLERHLADYKTNSALLKAELGRAKDDAGVLREQLAAAKSRHEEEMRMLRFELGEAQDTVAQTEELNGQLASDLIDTRGFKEELERMLCENDEKSRLRIDELERQVGQLREVASESAQQLQAKSEAINVLLSELARKTEQLNAIGDIEHAIHDIDEKMSGRLAERETESPPMLRAAPGDRVTRVLVGTIDQQEVRFPLFKDRLTIGRTNQNDIQLRAAYVSRRHAVVITEQQQTRIIDWGSKNGVYVNSSRIKEHFLANGDVISIGNARFRYEERPKRDA